MRALRLLGLVLDLLLLVASVVRGGALVEGLRIVLVVVAAMVGAVVVFVAVVVAVALVDQRRPPYPM